jgi:hypothetical protein
MAGGTPGGTATMDRSSIWARVRGAEAKRPQSRDSQEDPAALWFALGIFAISCCGDDMAFSVGPGPAQAQTRFVRG